MDTITVVYDREGNTLDVWFVKPRKAICEEMGNGIILKKDSKGNVIGFEKLNYLKRRSKNLRKIPLETIVA